MVTGLVVRALFVGPTLAQLAGQQRVANVVLWAGAHGPVVAVPVVAWSTLSVGAARVGVAEVSCGGEERRVRVMGGCWLEKCGMR